MFVKHPEWDKQMQVTVDTAVAHVLTHIINHHSTIREKDLIIQVAGHDAKSRRRSSSRTVGESEFQIYVEIVRRTFQRASPVNEVQIERFENLELRGLDGQEN
jgi:hypothetical protein